MKKLLLGTTLVAGMMATGAAQADTGDVLLGGLLGVAVGVSLADDDDHRHRVAHHHYYEPRPVRRHYYHAPPRHHHPRGHAYGYWRKHDKHHQQRVRHHDRRDWDRRDGRHDGRRDRDGRDGRHDGRRGRDRD